MAWTLLPTNYTDAVWDGMKKYNQINNPDGTISLQDVTVYTNKENSFFGSYARIYYRSLLCGCDCVQKRSNETVRGVCALLNRLRFNEYFFRGKNVIL